MQAQCDCSQGRSIASPHRAPEWQANGYLTLECCAVNSKHGGQQTGELLPKHLDSIESPACKDIQSSTCLDATQGLRSGDLGLRGMWRFTLSNSHHSANGGEIYELIGIAGIQCKRRQTQVLEFFLGVLGRSSPKNSPVGGQEPCSTFATSTPSPRGSAYGP